MNRRASKFQNIKKLQGFKIKTLYNNTHQQFVILFPILDPRLSLRLRIDQKRISARLRNNDAVLHRQSIAG